MPPPGIDDDLKCWLALLRAPGIGCRTYLGLLDKHPPHQLYTESPQALRSLGLQAAAVEAIQQPDWAAVENDLAWLHQDPSHNLITFSDPRYPPQLQEIADPPPLLFVRGEPKWLSEPQIAIVGSRNPSSLGVETAFDFARSLSQSGFVITSGLALGIDSAGHEGALSTGNATIAVAGTGPDRVYPARNQDLARKIVQSGAIISEFPPGTPAKAHHFPRRNRIISGLCQGLLVVEAAKASGSLITARMALEQNREVFAIPGSIHNPLARGCNALIREGAKLVENHQDVLDELTQYKQQVNFFAPETRQSMLDLEQQTLLNLVMFSPTSVDTLVEKSGKPVEIVSSMLLILELHGYLEATPGGCYTRLK